MAIDPMEQATVCLLGEAHLAAVAELEALCFSEPWSCEALRLLTNPENFGVVVLIGERVVAYGGVTSVLDEGSVTNIATHPDFRRRGFGHAVLEALLAEADRRGLAEIFLEVRVSNVAACRLYEKHGFLAVGTRRSFYRFPTEDAVVMKWEKHV